MAGRVAEGARQHSQHVAGVVVIPLLVAESLLPLPLLQNNKQARAAVAAVSGLARSSACSGRRLQLQRRWMRRGRGRSALARQRRGRGVGGSSLQLGFLRSGRGAWRTFSRVVMMLDLSTSACRKFTTPTTVHTCQGNRQPMRLERWGLPGLSERATAAFAR